MIDFDFGVGDLLGFAGDVAGGFFGSEAAGKTAAANTANAEANRRAADARLDKSLGALQFSDAFGSRTRDDAGGFTSTQLGGADAAQARANLAQTDVRNTQDLEQAFRNFKPTIPTDAAARDIVERDRKLKADTIIEPGLDKLASLSARTYGGVGNTGKFGADAAALQRLYGSTQIGGEEAALNLRNKQTEADNALLSQMIANYTRQVPAPGFSTGGAQSAGQIAAQSPFVQGVPDLAGAVPYAAGQQVIGDMLARTQRSSDDALLRQYLARGLGAGGSGSWGGSSDVVDTGFPIGPA
jgi:hypothetical protein